MRKDHSRPHCFCYCTRVTFPGISAARHAIISNLVLEFCILSAVTDPRIVVVSLKRNVHVRIKTTLVTLTSGERILSFETLQPVHFHGPLRSCYIKTTLMPYSLPVSASSSPSPTMAQSATKSRTVGIVGAGMSGLRCADILIRSGVKVTILEARGRIGGRVAQSDRLGRGT